MPNKFMDSNGEIDQAEVARAAKAGELSRGQIDKFLYMIGDNLLPIFAAVIGGAMGTIIFPGAGTVTGVALGATIAGGGAKIIQEIDRTTTQSRDQGNGQRR